MTPKEIAAQITANCNRQWSHSGVSFDGIEEAIAAAIQAERDTAKGEHARSQYIPSIKELTPQPWGVTVQELPGGAFLLNPTENEERVRVAYLKAMEAKVEAARKAIEPFARIADEADQSSDCVADHELAYVSIGYCRAAKEWVDSHTLRDATTTNEGEK